MKEKNFKLENLGKIYEGELIQLRLTSQTQKNELERIYVLIENLNNDKESLV